MVLLDVEVFKVDIVEIILMVNNIEVIYDYVILVLKGVLFMVLKGGIVVLFGVNGVGKIIMFKVVLNFLWVEWGEVIKGQILFEGEEVQVLLLNDFVCCGCIQVMEGWYCFGYLLIEENFLIGVYICKDGYVVVKVDFEMVYNYFFWFWEW